MRVQRSSLFVPLFVSPSRESWIILLLFAVAFVCSSSLAVAQSNNSVGSPYRLETPGQVVDGSATLVQHYDSTKMLRLTLAVQPPHMAEEEQFLQDLRTKGSPEYRHYLSAEEWTKRFDPSEQDEQAVVDWAKSQGFTITHRFPNRLLVDVEAPVGTLEKAFSVTINTYQLGNTTFFSNDRDPEIPTSLTGVLHSVQGLNSLQRMYPANPNMAEPVSPDYVPGPAYTMAVSDHADGSRALLKQAMKAHSPKAAKGTTPNFTNGNLDPTDLYGSNAYDYNALYAQGHCCNPLGNANSSPPESSIAIASFGSQAISDIAGFHNQYPYLAYDINEVFIDGSPACCDAEGTLDMEWSTAMSNSFGSAGNTAHVWVYDGANFNDSTFTDIYNHMLNDGHAKVFTTSWSCTEFFGCSSSTMDSRHAIFNSMLGQGWTLFTASGDRGAYDDCSHLAVSYPASDPDLVGVGGTFLQLFSDSTFDFENAWAGGTSAGSCSSNNGGSGGGCSSKFSAPSYQGSSPACGTGSRSVPDISLNAAYGQNYYFNGALSGTGGTSISSPEMAGFAAQENAYLLALGNACFPGTSSPCAPMGSVFTSAVYFEGFNPGYAPHYPFYDITSGCNSNDIGTGYCAGTGYDLVTGWGTSNMLQLAWLINWNHASDDARPTVSFSGPATNTWYNTDQTVSWGVTDSGGGGVASGVAGFSQAWDFDPGDVVSEPTPGSGNSFYSGPQFPNATGGCLELAGGGGCAGGVSQGCHTAHVRAWDNMGLGSGDSAYGPVCYDTISPVTTSSLAGTKTGAIFVSTVKDTLSASDFSPGSGVASTVYQINGGTVQTYTGPFTISANGTYTVAFHSTDVAHNVEGTESTSFTVARWLPETSGSSAMFHGISCVSTTKCEVVGAGGAIRGTTNGGSTWPAQVSGTTNSLNAISCQGAFCVAVGNTGTIRVTTNSGGAWNTKTSGTTQNLDGVNCVNSTFCVAVGDAGTILVTSNGGGSWSKKTSGTTNNLKSVSCSTTSVCRAVGQNGTIRATGNGGANWTGQTSGTANNLLGIDCPAGTTFCAAVGTVGNIVVTTNNGTTWSKKTSGTTNNLNSVSCSTATVCRAVGAAGTIRATINGGGTWSAQPSGTTNALFGVDTQSATLAYSAGSAGTILKQ